MLELMIIEAVNQPPAGLVFNGVEEQDNCYRLTFPILTYKQSHNLSIL